MARVPDVARRRFFSSTPLDTLILISFNSGFSTFFTQSPLFGKCGFKLPPQSLHVNRATIFPSKNRCSRLYRAIVFLLKSGDDQKKKRSSGL